MNGAVGTTWRRRIAVATAVVIVALVVTALVWPAGGTVPGPVRRVDGAESRREEEATSRAAVVAIRTRAFETAPAAESRRDPENEHLAPPWSGIRVRVLDEAGVPLARASLLVSVHQDESAVPAAIPTAVVTGATGASRPAAAEPRAATYNVNLDAAGRFLLRVRPEVAGELGLASDALVAKAENAMPRGPGARKWRVMTTFAPPAAYTVVELPDVRVPALTLLASGTVEDATGRAVEKAGVFAAEADETVLSSTSDLTVETDRDGRFTIYGRPLGRRVALAASKADAGASTLMTVDVGARDVRLQLAGFGHITGRIVVQGDMAAAACGDRLWVGVKPDSPAGAEAWRHEGLFLGKSLSLKADGAFSVRVPSGSYSVSVSNGGYTQIAVVDQVAAQADAKTVDPRLDPLTVSADALTCFQVTVRDRRHALLSGAQILMRVTEANGAQSHSWTGRTGPPGTAQCSLSSTAKVNVTARKAGFIPKEVIGAVSPVTIELDEAHVVRVAFTGTANLAGAQCSAVLVESPSLAGQPVKVPLPLAATLGVVRDLTGDGELVFDVPATGAYDIIITQPIRKMVGVLTETVAIRSGYGIRGGSVRVPEAQHEVVTSAAITEALGRAIQELSRGE